jgi:tRNA A-37 threonylcarbamoyl transferase component Bud32
MSSAHDSDHDRHHPGPLPPALAAYTEYEVIRKLGRGGMGVVYLARNRLMDRFEALKLRAGSGRGEEFLREVQAAARLAHPNIVAVYSARFVLDTLVLAMEYVDGYDLARLVAVCGPPSVPAACELVRQAALGLQHAHDAGVVHRDVKPANLILSRAGRPAVKVLDFGLAWAGHDDGEVSAGTPAYAAPEQFTDPRRVDTRSDVYALGGTLYFLLTGGPPFPGETGTEVLRRHRQDAPPRPDTVRPGVPAEVATLIGRMLAKDPAARPPSAAEVARVLDRYAGAGDSVRDWVGPLPDRAETVARVPGETSTLGEGGLSLSPTVNLRASAGRGAPLRRLRAGLVVGLLVGCLCTGSASRGDRPAPDLPGMPAAGAVPAGPVPLFDGRSLAGWVVDGGDAGEWRIENGAIVTTGTPNGPRTWLLSAREYGDVRVRFEYRLEPGGNSGFVLRAVPGECPVLAPGRPTPAPYHQQVEISDDASPKWARFPTGQVNGAATSTGPALKPQHRARVRPSGEWNRMEVELRGQGIRVRVNGEDVLADNLDRLIGLGSPYPALRRPRGRIGFQQHLKTAEFRNIAIEELGP